MMILRSPKDHRIAVFEDLEPFFIELLRSIPEAADPGDSIRARDRLFSKPLAKDDAGFNEDWREYVEPELRDMFRSAQEIVTRDLRALPPADPRINPAAGKLDSAAFSATEHKLEIPRDHADAWLGVLNQARLVIAAKRNFGDLEMDEDASFPPASERELDLYRVHFYGDLQHVLLREMGLA
jgi:hypothetical protein